MSANEFLMMAKEPRVADVPKRVWRDWALVGALAPVGILEAIFRPDVEWRSFSLAWFLAMLPALFWRRTEPLLATGFVFGSMTVVSLSALVAGAGSIGLYSMAACLILAYSVNRWGSGREATIALVIMVLTWATSLLVDYTGLGDAIGGLIVLLFPAEFGAMVRYQQNTRRQQLEQARSETRQQLARELHDTVAHHVSAIAIQAQAGRTVAASDPDTAAEVLGVIEEVAARALTEMRNMVGALRSESDDDAVNMAPQPGLADIERLADISRYAESELSISGNGGDVPRIDVVLDGDLDGLRPSVDTALYRLAQESITNAIRHARNASQVLVRVVGNEQSVRITVEDDGVHNPPPSGTAGFGLVGMTERVALLGGSFDAGPNGRRGWTVDAVLPRTGSPV